MKPYFAILTTQSGTHTPMIDAQGNMEFFESLRVAELAAQTSGLGEAFGWEVFEIGLGVREG